MVSHSQQSALKTIICLIGASTTYMQDSDIGIFLLLIVLLAILLIAFVMQQLIPQWYSLGLKFITICITLLGIAVLFELIDVHEPAGWEIWKIQHTGYTLSEINGWAIGINVFVLVCQLMMRQSYHASFGKAKILIWDYSFISFACAGGLFGGDVCSPYRSKQIGRYDPVHGHAALLIENPYYYLSWWPSHVQMTSNFKGVISAIGNNKSHSEDVKAEGHKDPLQGHEGTQLVMCDDINIDGLLAWWYDFLTSRNGKPEWIALNQNCSTIVINALRAGGACAWYEFWRSIFVCTPSNALVYVQTTNSSINYICCFVVRTLMVRLCIEYFELLWTIILAVLTLAMLKGYCAQSVDNHAKNKSKYERQVYTSKILDNINMANAQ